MTDENCVCSLEVISYDDGEDLIDSKNMMCVTCLYPVCHYDGCCDIITMLGIASSDLKLLHGPFKIVIGLSDKSEDERVPTAEWDLRDSSGRTLIAGSVACRNDEEWSFHYTDEEGIEHTTNASPNQWGRWLLRDYINVNGEWVTLGNIRKYKTRSE